MKVQGQVTLSHICNPVWNIRTSLLAVEHVYDEGCSQELSEKPRQTAAMPQMARSIYLERPAEVLDKKELRVAAMRKLNVSKSALDFACIDVIKTTGRRLVRAFARTAA